MYIGTTSVGSAMMVSENEYCQLVENTMIVEALKNSRYRRNTNLESHDAYF